MTKHVSEGDARLLIVEDDDAMGSLLEKDLARRSFAITSATSAEQALALADAEPFDAIVVDLRPARMTGRELCEVLVARWPDVPVILVTPFGDFDAEIAAMRAGAHDFLREPFEVEELALRIAHAIELRSLRAEVRRLRESVAPATSAED